MIVITVEGIEKLLPILQKLRPENIRSFILDCVERELDRLYNIIQNEPDIPPDYQYAVFTWRNDDAGTAGIGVFIMGEMQYARFGRVVIYKEYRCPVRKYYGGAITPAWTGPDYLKMIWEREKDTVINNIKSSILSYLGGR